MIRVEKYVLRVVRVDKSTPVEKKYILQVVRVDRFLSTGQIELSSGKMHLISSLKGQPCDLMHFELLLHQVNN